MSERLTLADQYYRPHGDMLVHAPCGGVTVDPDRHQPLCPAKDASISAGSTVSFFDGEHFERVCAAFADAGGDGPDSQAARSRGHHRHPRYAEMPEISKDWYRVRMRAALGEIAKIGASDPMH